MAHRFTLRQRSNLVAFGAIVQASSPRGDIDLRGVALYIKADASDQRSSLDIMADIDEIIGNFAVLDDWDDRYRDLIELGRELPPLAEAAHSDANKVQGCASKSGSTPLCALTARAAQC